MDVNENQEQQLVLNLSTTEEAAPIEIQANPIDETPLESSEPIVWSTNELSVVKTLVISTSPFVRRSLEVFFLSYSIRDVVKVTVEASTLSSITVDKRAVVKNMPWKCWIDSTPKRISLLSIMLHVTNKWIFASCYSRIWICRQFSVKFSFSRTIDCFRFGVNIKDSNDRTPVHFAFRSSNKTANGAPVAAAPVSLEEMFGNEVKLKC